MKLQILSSKCTVYFLISNELELEFLCLSSLTMSIFFYLRPFHSNKIVCEFNVKFLKQAVLTIFSCTCDEHGRRTCMKKYDLKKKIEARVGRGWSYSHTNSLLGELASQ